jgi:hypothetical protein
MKSYFVVPGVEPGVFFDRNFLMRSLFLLLRSSFVSPTRALNKSKLAWDLFDDAGLFLVPMLELIDDRDATLPC